MSATVSMTEDAVRSRLRRRGYGVRRNRSDYGRIIYRLAGRVVEVENADWATVEEWAAGGDAL